VSFSTRAVKSQLAPDTEGNYAQSLEITGATRWLYVSGQIPVDLDGQVPLTFEDQCRRVWSNLIAQPRAADMGVENLVKVTIFLSDRAYALANREIRLEVIGSHQPALSCIITGIFDSNWLLEIEAIAAS
jgi:enamine deaminase RidA (YjgF/YER057c/UK114 family)